MLNSSRIYCLFTIAVFTGCQSTVRDLDFINKRFQATYNIDSTRALDSMQVAALRNSKAIYQFSEDGKGILHIQTGMLSNDTPFSWMLKDDSLSIDQAVYQVQKELKGMILRNDSVKLVFSQQP
ncbi:hypothetical protein [Spirosoma gilvum]